MAKAEIVVLGAGVVGLSCAIHLQRSGLSVTLVDRGDPGCETSFGNAGVLARGSIVPFSTPAVWRKLHRYALNRDAGLRLDPTFLPQLTPWLLRFLRACTETRAMAISEAMNEMLHAAVEEHVELIEAAGASHLLRRDGWVRVFRDERGFEAFRFEHDQLKRLGVVTEVVDAAGLAKLEPNLKPIFARGIWYPQNAAVTDPGALCQAFAELFQQEGGLIRRGQARTLRHTGNTWRVELDGDALETEQLVLALGAWSADLLTPLGIHLPLLWERGYHLHFDVAPERHLQRPVNDIQGAYVIAPMGSGHRITSGIEFAARDAHPTPFQVERAAEAAGEAVHLGKRLDAQPWLGRRPSMPDTVPVIGPAPGYSGLWLAFGHGHVGFTAGPLTGRLIADLVVRRRPVIDPAPFSPSRFG